MTSTTDPIQLVQAAEFYRRMPHQIAALNWLQDQLSTEQLREFADLFRAGPVPREIALAAAFLQEPGIEGFSATAYPDPYTGSAPWTIGWGSTRVAGRPVVQGQTITEDQAELELLEYLRRSARTLAATVPVWPRLTHNQRAALLSLAYNIGSGFMTSGNHQTLADALTCGDLDAVPDAFRLYVNPGSKVEAGLRQRREREIALWHGGAPTPAAQALRVEAPYYKQTDSRRVAQRDRSCFSSANAMMLEAIKPGSLPHGPNGDDAYLDRVLQHGDTTDPRAQVLALRSYGITARRITTATWELVAQQLRKGRPVPLGLLHRGPIDRPTGGHWVTLVELGQDHAVIHDPFGRPDLVTGETLPGSGEACRVSRDLLYRRWSVAPSGGVVRGHGWAMVVDGVQP